MDGREFWDRVHSDKRLEYKGCRAGATAADDVVFVEHPRGKEMPSLRFEVHISAILKNSWDDLLAIFLGHRQPTVMKHVSRIVGYYSYTYGWNRSKLAELADRHKGNYALPEVA